MPCTPWIARLSAPLAIGLLALAGCHRGAQSDIIERELRWQENQIFELEDAVAEFQHLARQYRMENARLRQQLAEEQFTGSDDRWIGKWPDDKSRREDRTEPPVPLLPEKEPDETPSILPEPELPEPTELQLDPEDLEPPQIDLGRTPRQLRPEATRQANWIGEQPFDGSSAQRPWIGEAAADDLAEPILLDELPLDAPHESAHADNNVAFDDPAVEREMVPIFMPDVPVSYRAENTLLEAELLASDAGRAELVLVSITPLTNDHERAYFDGQVSVMIRDPAAPPGEARLVRWDLSPEEVAQAWTMTSRGSKLQFEVELPEGLPTDRLLELWTRLTTSDGRKLLAQMLIDLSAGAAAGGPVTAETGQSTTGWVSSPPHAADWNAPQAQQQSGWRTAESPPPTGDDPSNGR